MKSALAVIGGVIAFALVCIGGWFLYWHLVESATERRGGILQDTYGRQNALVEQILDDYRDVNDPTLPQAQRHAITVQLCNSASKLNGTIVLPFEVRTFIEQECTS